MHLYIYYMWSDSAVVVDICKTQHASVSPSSLPISAKQQSTIWGNYPVEVGVYSQNYTIWNTVQVFCGSTLSLENKMGQMRNYKKYKTIEKISGNVWMLPDIFQTRMHE